MKIPFVASLILTILLLATIFPEPAMAVSPGYCEDNCKLRCGKAGVLDRCLKYCSICCEKCKCVPSGTYGNKHQCPCYRDLRSSKGTPKCP